MYVWTSNYIDMGKQSQLKLQLTEEEHNDCLRFIKTGRAKSRVIQRVLVVLKLGEGLSPNEIISQIPISQTGVYNTYHRFMKGGLQAVIEEQPVSGQPRRLNAEGEATLIALACSEAPDGCSHWTMQLLADKLVELKCVDRINDETVRQYLKKAGLNPGNMSSGALRR